MPAGKLPKLPVAVEAVEVLLPVAVETAGMLLAVAASTRYDVFVIWNYNTSVHHEEIAGIMLMPSFCMVSHFA
jgi:hypothetical protein